MENLEKQKELLKGMEKDLKEMYGEEVDSSDLRRIVEELRVINKQLELDNKASVKVAYLVNEAANLLSEVVADLD